MTTLPSPQTATPLRELRIRPRHTMPTRQAITSQSRDQLRNQKMLRVD